MWGKTATSNLLLHQCSIQTYIFFLQPYTMGVVKCPVVPNTLCIFKIFLQIQIRPSLCVATDYHLNQKIETQRKLKLPLSVLP